MNKYTFGDIVLVKLDTSIVISRIIEAPTKYENYYDGCIYDQSESNQYSIISFTESAIINKVPDGKYNGIFADENARTVKRLCSIVDGILNEVCEYNKWVMYKDSPLLCKAVYNRSTPSLKNHKVELEERLFK